MKLSRIATVVALTLSISGHGATAPIFDNSVVSNDLDFIRPDDSGTFACLRYDRRSRVEMPHKLRDELFVNDTFIFTALFDDGTSVEIWVNPDVGSRNEARRIALQAAEPVGLLPTIMRSRLDHVVIHKGNETAYAEDRGRFFVLYSGNMATRIRKHDLEETVFHEAVHATLDHPRGARAEWLNAQHADGGFITRYARRKTNYAGRNPFGEDMAESALFAWAVLIHPGRLPKSIERSVRSIMPNRLEYFEEIFVNSGQELMTTVPNGRVSNECASRWFDR